MRVAIPSFCPLKPLLYTASSDAHGVEPPASGTSKSLNQPAMEQVWRQAVREHEAEVTRW